jgi:hypothetical protein
MIRRFGIGCVLVAALAMPAGAFAEGPSGEVKNASKHCRALRAEMGPDAFRDQFGASKNKRNAFGKCVSKYARAEHRAATTALRECKAEYVADPAAFLAKYGSEPATTSVERPSKPEGDLPGGTGSDEPTQPDAALRAAMHKCVALKLKALRTERREVLENAAKQCKEERGDSEESREAFRSKYGTNENGHNAFGKCVSQKVRKGAAPPVEPTPETPAAGPEGGTTT